MTGHAFAGVSRAINRKFNTLGPAELTAYLPAFYAGDEGLRRDHLYGGELGMIPMMSNVIAIASSGRGADTSVIIKPAHLIDIFDP